MTVKVLIGYVIADEVYCTDARCHPQGIDLDEAFPLYDSDHWFPSEALVCRSCRKQIKGR